MHTKTAFAALVVALPLAESAHGFEATADVGMRADTAEADSKEDPKTGLAAQNSLDGATGLVHVKSADSGSVGSLRVSLMSNLYSGDGFLCPDCENVDGTVSTEEDAVDVFGTRLQVSATPLSFLEASAAMRFQSTSNDRGRPEVVQIVGDTTLGVKGFLPREVDRIVSFGGGAGLALLNQAGGIGTEAASFGFYGASTLDLTNQKDASARFPFRAHVNLGYWFDNSAALSDEVEESRGDVLGEPTRITRIERFGHDINRVDSFRAGIGAEGVFDYVRPFAEWTIDVPVNRQDYQCKLARRSAGDACLSQEGGFASTPSRVTLGVRGYPWVTDWTEGLALLAALDVGTGATSTFIEEVAPELPWAVYLGVGYAFDTSATPEVVPQVVERVVEAPPPPERYVRGLVANVETGEPIGGALVRYAGSDAMGLIADSAGRFRTTNLEPGTYRFVVSAEGYRDENCEATIPLSPPPSAPQGTAGTGGSSGAATSGAAVASGEPALVEDTIVPLKCELEPLPKVATISGVVRDAETTEFVAGASVAIRDPRSRSLTLTTDGRGAFRFENVPAGESTLTINAEGYLQSAVQVAIEPRKDVTAQLTLNPRPKQPNVVITPGELRLREQVHFLHDSAEILPDSMALIEEIADVLRQHAEIAQVEIQGHTDDSGTPEYNLDLSNRRANAVRDALIQHGVDSSRLTARGYGQENPLVPNTSDRNKARNRRVQLVIPKNAP